MHLMFKGQQNMHSWNSSHTLSLNITCNNFLTIYTRTLQHNIIDSIVYTKQIVELLRQKEMI